MHELGITQNIVAIASEYAAGAKVRQVSVEIGKLTAILPDAVRFCFDVCCQGTLLEGATLDIIETPGMGRCRSCGAELEMAQPFGTCACGSHELEILQGQELKIKTLETEELCV
ncbi:MAG: hydrogenase maturation nickel metallochaperone HypA [Oculatellaceae cyanobacterium Prado106]|nr:hydrogenase maturation nickel metallochaperone HypA [Oculatellaceae cyanobacterium Prado106]